jgi:hypothetical protein
MVASASTCADVFCRAVLIADPNVVVTQLACFSQAVAVVSWLLTLGLWYRKRIIREVVKGIEREFVDRILGDMTTRTRPNDRVAQLPTRPGRR